MLHTSRLATPYMLASSTTDINITEGPFQTRMRERDMQARGLTIHGVKCRVWTRKGWINVRKECIWQRVNGKQTVSWSAERFSKSRPSFPWSGTPSAVILERKPRLCILQYSLPPFLYAQDRNTSRPASNASPVPCAAQNIIQATPAPQLNLGVIPAVNRCFSSSPSFPFPCPSPSSSAENMTRGSGDGAPPDPYPYPSPLYSDAARSGVSFISR